MPAGTIPAALSGLATGLGALPFLFVRDLPRRAYDGILGLGAGLMLAAATLGLVAEALRGVTDAGGFHARAAGAGAGRVRRRGGAGRGDGPADPAPPRGRSPPAPRPRKGHDVHDRHDAAEEARDARRAYAVVGALSLHRIPEGLAIGAGFAPRSSHLGLVLAVAIGVQNVCEGIVMSAPLRHEGVGRWRGLAIVALTGLVIPGRGGAGRRAGRRGRWPRCRSSWRWRAAR